MKAKNLLLVLALAVSTQSLQAKTLIISDVDDTIKVSDAIGSKFKNALNAIFKTTAFAGMSELYQELDKKDETVFYYVSGAPKILTFRARAMLKKNEFPQTENLILKDKNQKDTYTYKVATIRDIIKKVNPDKMILLGDDTEVDSEVYNKISEENPGIVDGIYIRSIRNKAVNAITFISPVEIAATEVLKGQLEGSSLKVVTEAFINQPHHSAISIKNRYCPKEGRVYIEELKQRVSDQVGIDLLERAQAKIITSCN